MSPTEMPFAMNSFRGKRVLALLRGGDYAHAGEEEAIELTLAAVPKKPDQRVLDAGCGRGGTADYMQRNGWGRVTGIDQEARSIAHAREAYRSVQFRVCDICEAGRQLTPYYEVVTLFDVLYALTDHGRALAALAAICLPEARLAVFTYVDRGAYQTSALLDADGPFLPHPPKLAEIEPTFSTAGWRIESVQEIGSRYEHWYIALVAKIERRRVEIEGLAGVDGYVHVHSLYRGLLDRFRDGRLGGAIILGRRREGVAP